MSEAVADDDVAQDLRLREEGRELIFKGQLKKRGGGGTDSAELQVFLFDHAILMVKQKNSKQTDQLKVYRKPIPLELLTITGVSEDAGTLRGAQGRKMLMTRTSTGGKMPANGVPPPPQNKQGFSITLNHLGRKGYTIVLWAPTWASRQKWLDKIEGRQAELRDRSLIFEMTSLNEGSFTGANKVNCAAPFGKSSAFRRRGFELTFGASRQRPTMGLWDRHGRVPCDERPIGHSDPRHRPRQRHAGRRARGAGHLTRPR